MDRVEAVREDDLTKKHPASFGRRGVNLFAGLLALVMAICVSGVALASTASADQMAYVTNSHNKTVVPIDVSTGVEEAPIEVGASPLGIAINPKGTLAYVADAGENAITPIDLETGTAEPKITIGNSPVEVAFTP